jgi:hypothetical protein
MRQIGQSVRASELPIGNNLTAWGSANALPAIFLLAQFVETSNLNCPPQTESPTTQTISNVRPKRLRQINPFAGLRY